MSVTEYSIGDSETSGSEASADGGIGLDELFAALDAFRVPIPLEVIEENLRSLEVKLSDLEPYVQFGEDGYLRNLVHESPCYQALLLCWRNGQRSPIHDHKGSACGVRVMLGTATETIFERAANGMIYATVSAEAKEGTVCASEDSDIHQVSNLQPGNADLITLHIYSPPLRIMGIYSLTDPRVIEGSEPVNVPLFMDGGGI